MQRCLVLLLLWLLAALPAPARATGAAPPAPDGVAVVSAQPAAAATPVTGPDAPPAWSPTPDLRVMAEGASINLRHHGRWTHAPADDRDVAERLLTGPAMTALGGQGQGEALWGHLLVAFEGGAHPSDWFVRIPFPSLDVVRLYTRAGPGQPWVLSQAGDRVSAQAHDFTSLDPLVQSRVQTPVQEWLLEIRHHGQAASLPVLLVPVDTVLQTSLVRALAAGGLLGLSGLLVVLALVHALRHRSGARLVATGYYLTVTAALAVHLGVGSTLLWGRWPALSHWSRFAVLTLLMAAWTGMNALVLDLRARAPRLARAVAIWCGLLLVLGFGLPLLGSHDRAAVWLLRAGLYSGFTVTLGLTLWLLRLGYRDAWPALAAVLTVFGTAMVTAGYNQGWLPLGPGAWYVYPAGLLAGAVSLFVLHERQAAASAVAQARAEALTRHDALTGLPNQASAAYSYARMARRMAFFRAGAVCARVRLLNPQDFVAEGGRKLLDECLVHLSARLRLTLRPIDLLARLDDGDFIILLEGRQTPDSARDAATRWVASALRTPVRGVTPRLLVAMTDFGAPEDQLDHALETIDALLVAGRADRPERLILDAFGDRFAQRAG